MDASPFALSSLETAVILNKALCALKGPAASCEHWSASLASKRGKQRSLLYDLDVHVDGQSKACHYQWVGKFYREDEDARKVTSVLRQLEVTDCRARGNLVVPRVITYDAARRLLLLSYETG